MNKQDCVGINNWQEVERRLQAQNQIIGVGNNTIVKVNNTLNSFLNALVLNLKDIIEDQSEISLWFYSIDEPTTSTEPYISWTNPNDHIGDFMYSRTKGIVYQYTSSGWIKNTDATLLKAMALTDSELASTVHERKVFTTQPTPPYNSGDWWIKSDGSLFICQIGKTDKYNENDFISSVNYAGAIAEKTGNVLEVLKGTVITTTDSAVIYLDKATGTTSQISGDSIRTGIIQSNNYVSNQVGMAINLNRGLINTKNFKLDEQGNVNLYNGATVITEKGLLTNLEFKSAMDYEYLGFKANDVDRENERAQIKIESAIPDNFTIVSAKIILFHKSVDYIDSSNNSRWGYSRNIRLYKNINVEQSYRTAYFASEYYDNLNANYQEISNAFGSNGFTAQTPTYSSHNIEKATSIDISNQISRGLNQFVLQTADSIPSFIINEPLHEQNWIQITQKTGLAYAILNVIGYMNFN